MPGKFGFQQSLLLLLLLLLPERRHLSKHGNLTKKIPLFDISFRGILIGPKVVGGGKKGRNLRLGKPVNGALMGLTTKAAAAAAAAAAGIADNSLSDHIGSSSLGAEALRLLALRYLISVTQGAEL
jgi:hypothetical protein